MTNTQSFSSKVKPVIRSRTAQSCVHVTEIPRSEKCKCAWHYMVSIGNYK